MQKFSRKTLEKKREESRRALEEHKRREERFRKESEKKAKKKRNVAISATVLVLLLFGAVAYWMLSPGKYDDFAKCLTEKGAVMYGEDWCKYTNAQKAMFGRSFKYINYEQKPDLRKRPTWVIDGKTYETVQSFQRLSELTGCTF